MGNECTRQYILEGHFAWNGSNQSIIIEMKNHKFQQIRVSVLNQGDSVRFDAETDKDYARVKGIYVLIPEERVLAGTSLGLKVNKLEIFDDAHDIRLITCGQQVAPNQKFFLFEEEIEALGSAFEGRITDPKPLPPVGGVGTPQWLPYDAVIYLWLTNDALK